LPLEFAEILAGDDDLPALRLGLSEVQVGHEGEESFPAPWFEPGRLPGTRLEQGESGCIAWLVGHANSSVQSSPAGLPRQMAWNSQRRVVFGRWRFRSELFAAVCLPWGWPRFPGIVP
jgi:hypothetical protein